MIRPGWSIVQMLSDPDEGRFLQALLASADHHRSWLARASRTVLRALKLLTPADNRRTLLAYADHLGGRDVLRNELLRLEYLLSDNGNLGEIGPEQQSRYRELLGLLTPWAGWLWIIKRNDRLLNCGQASTWPLGVRFRYQCPNHWETLSPTPEAAVRYCGDCRRNVYFCESVESVERHASEGHCIAVPRRLTASVGAELTRDMTGMPDVHQLWGEKLFGS